MPRLIIGRAGSGKTQQCVGEIARACAADPLGPPLILLVPEQAGYQSERRLLEAGPVQGYSRAQVLSFTRLADWVFAHAPAPRLPRLTPTHRDLLAQLVVTTARAQAPDEFLDARGLEEALSALVSESRQYDLTPAKLRAAAEALSRRVGAETPRVSEFSRRKLIKLAELLERFNEAAANRFEDPHQTMVSLEEAIARSPLLQAAEVYVDGFHGFTSVEERVLLALALRAHRLTVALLGDPQRAAALLGGARLPASPVFRFAEETLARLLRMEHGGKLLEWISEPLAAVQRPRHHESLAHLEAHFQSVAPPQFAGAPAVEMWEAESPREEARKAAEIVAGWTASGRFEPARVAVLTRSLDVYAGPLQEAFRTLRIPCFIDRSEPLETHPIVTGLHALMRAALARGSSGDALIELGKCGLLTVARHDVDRIERHVRQHPRTEKEWYSARPWRRAAPRSLADDSRDDGERMTAEDTDFEGARRALAGPVTTFRKALGMPKAQEGVFRDFIRALCEFLRGAMEGREATAEEEQILARVGGLFSEALEVAGNDVVSWQLAGELASRALAQLSLPRIPPLLGRVLIGQVDRSRNPPLDAAIVLGLSEGQFPAPLRNGSLLNDDERDALEEWGFDARPSSRRQFAREAMFAYAAFASPNQHLVVMRSRGDGGSAKSTASPFWKDFERLFPGITVDDVGDVLTPARSWRARELAAADFRTRLHSHKEGPLASAPQVPPFAPGPALEEARAVSVAAAWKNAATLDPALVERFHERRLTVSTSQLEAFGACPHKHFVQYFLRPEELVEPRLQHTDAGNFLHGVLANFTRLLRTEGVATVHANGALREKLYEEAAEPLRQRLEDTGLLQRATARLTLEALEEHLRELVRWLVEAFYCTGFTPMIEEAGIYRSGAIEAMTLAELPEGWTGHVKGRIDRVDVRRGDGGWFFVVDYKLSRRGFDWDEWASGENFQLPIYLLAALDGCPGLEGLRPAGGLYLEIIPKQELTEEGTPKRAYQGVANAELYQEVFGGDLKWTQCSTIQGSGGDPLAEPRRWGTAVAPEEFAAMLEQTRARIADAAAAIISGDCRVAPSRRGNFTACGWCGLQPVCGIDYRVNRARLRVPRGRVSILSGLRGAES